MKVNKKIFNSIFTFLLFNFIFTQLAFASTFEQVMGGFSQTGKEAGYQVGSKGTPTKTFEVAWVNYINGMLTLMGALFMILIIYAGFIWMTAQGKDEKIEQAKKRILYATIGLVIIIGARLIIEFALFILGKTLPTA